jgi:Bor protein
MRRFLAAAVFALMGAGCAQTFDARGVAVPVTMASHGSDSVAGTQFSVRTHSTYVFWGLWSIDPPGLDRILATQLLAGAEIRNVRVRTKYRFLDLFLTAITAGIYSQKSITVDGIITSGPPASESQ